MEAVPAPPDAEASLRSQQRSGWQIAAGFVVAAVVLALIPHPLARVFALALVVAAFSGLGAHRTSSARRGLDGGCHLVLAVGWTRTPDGSNFALFPADADPMETEPTVVLRASRTTPTSTRRAILCGARQPDLLKAVALFDTSGEVLAVGRVRGPSSAARVWNNRFERSPWYWMGPDNQPPSV